MNTNSSRGATLALVAVTVAWGSTFLLVKDITSRMPVADFMALRFLLAAVVVFALRPRAVFALTAAEVRQGMAMGVVYGGAQLLQGIGLETTSASVSGFITGMYVVLTPLLGAALLRMKISRSAWIATALATVGLGILSLNGLSIGSGEILTLLSAALFAGQILGLARWSKSSNFMGLSIVQLATITVVCAIPGFRHGVVLPHTSGDWTTLIFMALVSGALALIVQTWAQGKLSATKAAIVMTMEPIWAAFFAVVFGGETLGPRAVLGGLLVLIAMFLVEGSSSAPQERAVDGTGLGATGSGNELREAMPSTP